MKSFLKKIFAFFFPLLLLGSLFFIDPVFAQTVTTDDTFGGVSADTFAQTAGLGSESITVIIARIIRAVIGFLGVVAVGFVIAGGVRWITAAGDPAKVKKAQDLLKNALIGLVIVFASFSIAQFILSSLTEAVGGVSEEEEETSTYGSDTGDASDSFVLRSVNTECSELRNIQLQFVFSRDVLDASIEEKSGIVIAKTGGDAVQGTYTVSGKKATFVPEASCGDDYPDEHCFDADTDYTITLDSTTITSEKGESLECTLDYPCSFTFHTGTAVDVDAPTVSMTSPDDGGSVYLNTTELLQSFTKDDSGVSSLDFYLDGDVFYTSGLDETSEGTLALENYFYGSWDTEGYVSNKTYDLWAEGFDCAGNDDTSSKISVTMRAPNCDNGVQDGEEPYFEDGVDCGGEGDYYCGACAGESCSEDEECSSGQCSGEVDPEESEEVDGICVDAPMIEKISPGDGAPGNYISILGDGFGTDPGIVVFLGDPEDDFDDVIHEAIAACDGTWSDSQVIVELQEDTVSGPIEIMLSTGETDRTDNERGPVISDFVVNDTVRPGICSVEPDVGKAGDTLVITGNNFGDTQETGVYYIGSTEASSYPSWTASSMEIILPNISAKTYTTQVFVGPSDNRQGSNEVQITLQSSTSSTSGPIISFIDTGISLCSDGENELCTSDADCAGDATCEEALDHGPVGQYVTIYGSGFGTSTGTIHFEHQSTQEAALGDADFPAVCEDTYWSEDMIVIQVPETFNLEEEPTALRTGLYDLWVMRAEDGQISLPVNFTVIEGEAGPSICQIDPVSGPPGTEVVVYGERFGEETGEMSFYENQFVTPTYWTDETLSGDEESLVVPDEAKTGPVTVYLPSGQASNSMDFQVGICDEDFSCSTGTECCADGTCRTSGTCDTAVEPTSHYAYYFSTGDIPDTPEVVVACEEGVISPSPWEVYDGGNAVCINAIVTATFSVSMNASTLSAENIIVEKCFDADCRETETVSMDVENYPLISDSVYGSSSKFSWGPQAGVFEIGTHYQVTLNGGEETGALQSAEGMYMNQDYSWKFTTADSDTFCEIGDILLSPDTYTATQENEEIDYSAEPIASGYQCIVLACTDYSWGWSSDDPSRATVTASIDHICLADATALRETDPGKPVTITSVLQEEGISEEGELTINFTDPEVVDYAPDCDLACVNTSLKAEFNISMSDSVLSQGSVRLYRCENELCTDDLEEIVLGTPEYDSDAFWLVASSAEDLQANTYYRVIISGDIESQSGTPLSASGANYGNDFSWRFKTKDSEIPCAIDRVEIDPQTTTLTYVGEREEFNAYPYGEPDECSSSGQLLDWADYSWSSWTATDEPDLVEGVDILDLYENGNIVIADELPNWCTSTCLHAGSVAYSAICGNGIKETGEDCEDGNTTSGDGCSSICLSEGSLACTSEGQTNCCGDGDVGQYEECDDASAQDGDGCSSRCLNEGTKEVNKTLEPDVLCGNGDIAHSNVYGGEECDDGNVASGDGCSGVCLNEGSISKSTVTAICGNGGDPEDGEDCDDGNSVSGDGCSSLCLHEGSSFVYGSTCGNGGSPEKGEDCDDGNTQKGDGCSDICLLEGSSYLYGELTGGDPSICADGILGTGEECEESSSTDVNAPYAISTVTDQAPEEVHEGETGTATSIVAAQADGVIGQASVTLECSCASDYSCGDTDMLGCGAATSCCYPRPQLTAFLPDDGATNLCLNTAVWVVFDQSIDETTLEDHLFLKLTKIDGQTITESDCPESYVLSLHESQNPSSLLVRLWQWLMREIAGFFGVDAYAAEVSCVIPVSYGAEQDQDGTKISLIYSEALIPKGTYELVAKADGNLTDAIVEGVASIFGVGLAADHISDFTVGTEICALEKVVAEDQGKTTLTSEFDTVSPGYFSKAGEIHTITSTAYTIKGSTLEEIQEISGIYSWSWSGNEGEDVWGWSTTVSGEEDPVDVIDVDATETTATATGKNGSEKVIAQARIMEDELNTITTEGTIVDGSDDLTAYLCENPWPQADMLPFEHSSDRADDFTITSPYTNFSFFYCRDAGEEGIADDLPALEMVETPDAPVDSIFKEILFLVEGTSDAIGVRVVNNETYLSPEDWYAAQAFSGSPSSTTLDGYQAVSDDRTVYVAAANQNTGILYPNIYAISYNESPTDNTQEIVTQIFENWSFNANEDQLTDINNCETTAGSGEYLKDVNGDHFSCSTNAECIYAFQDDAYSSCDPTERDDCSYGFCDAQKAKVTKDLKRLSDLRSMEQILASYASEHGHCSVTKDQSCSENEDCPGSELCLEEFPTLPSGSFIRAFTTSAWPSWSAILGNDLGEALVNDPVNTFAQCPEGSDEAYCWNGTEGEFTCNEGSHAYLYQSVGSESYKLYAQLEYDLANWQYAIDTDLTDNAELFVEYAGYSDPDGFYQEGVLCDGTSIGNSGLCGDGVLGTDEGCEIGQTTSVSCSSGTITVACLDDCSRYQTADEAEVAGSECKLYSCGNGVLETTNGEECDDGSLNGTYGFCGLDCTVSAAFYCGDGSLAGGEACDNGEDNGQYEDVYADSCAFDCSFPGPTCGDKKINSTEECDGDTEAWSGKLCGSADDYLPCETNEDCEETSCGDGASACLTSQVCVGGSDEGLSCDADTDCSSGICSSASYQLERTRICSTICTWEDWSPSMNACAGGDQYCGNATLEGTEACDDGNDDNSDECTTGCTVNVCGDGNLYLNHESCDLGDSNGVECSPDYGSTCSYCDTSCRYTVLSGDFCGDQEIDSGEEFCDSATLPNYCYYANTNGDARDVMGTCEGDSDCKVCDGGTKDGYACDENSDCDSGVCSSGIYTCKSSVGVCNGGYTVSTGGDITDYNGVYCISGSTSSSDYCGSTSLGECVTPACADNCKNACPFTFDKGTILAQTEEIAGSAPEEAIELYSYLEGSPDTALLYIPSCEVGTTITADIDMSDVIPPSVDIVFITDLSGSMDSVLGSSTRIQVAVDAISSAITDLFAEYASESSQLRIATVSYATASKTTVGVDRDNDAVMEFADACVLDGDGDTTLAWLDHELSTQEKESDMLFNANYVTGTEEGKTESINILGYTAGVETYIARTTGTTPTAAGLVCADDQLASSAADMRIVILMSDGEPSTKLDGSSCSTTEDCVKEIVSVSDAMIDDGIQIYTAALTSETDLIGYMAHFSSDTCGTDYDNVADCEETTDIEYAYSASTAEDLQVMYQTIINSILGLIMKFTTEIDGETVVSGGPVREGDDVELTFPDGFECPQGDDEWTVPLRVTFNGEGIAKISDIQLTYCPVRE